MRGWLAQSSFLENEYYYITNSFAFSFHQVCGISYHIASNSKDICKPSVQQQSTCLKIIDILKNDTLVDRIARYHRGSRNIQPLRPPQPLSQGRGKPFRQPPALPHGRHLLKYHFRPGGMGGGSNWRKGGYMYCIIIM